MTDMSALAVTSPRHSRRTLPNGHRVPARLIDRIWHIEGSLALAPDQSSDDAFDRLDPLFRQPGTNRERTADTLTFSKRDQAAQDKMSIFDGGILRIERGVNGPMLYYRLASRMLLFCFLAPLLFLSFAGLTIAAAKYEKQSTEAAAKKDDKKDTVLPQNPIDKFLGAPAPEKPGKDKKEDKDKGPTPTAAYVFAGIFALLYVAGRILEARLIKSLFKKCLTEPSAKADALAE